MARLFILDDDPDQLRMMTLSLEHHGHGVTATGQLEAARASLKDLSNFDCFIIDIWLQNRSSIGLIEDIRAQCDALPIIVISGGNMDVPLEQSFLGAMWRGATKFLFKPFASTELQAAIEEVLATASDTLKSKKRKEKPGAGWQSPP